jgi:hypothetical protein
MEFYYIKPDSQIRVIRENSWRLFVRFATNFHESHEFGMPEPAFSLESKFIVGLSGRGYHGVASRKSGGPNPSEQSTQDKSAVCGRRNT